MRVDVAQLLKQPPGTQVNTEVDLGFQCLGDDVPVNTVRGQLRLSRTNEGIWVQGTLEVTVDLQCARCLRSIAETIQVKVGERFQPHPRRSAEDEGVLPIEDGKYLDLEPILRELVVVGTPMRALCRSDCSGLCPICGQDLNQGPCNCEPDEDRHRLAALKTLIREGESQ